MTIVVTHLQEAQSLENVSTLAIPSFTLPANRLGMIEVVQANGLGSATNPTIPGWVEHYTIYIGGARRTTLFRRVVGTDTTEGLTVSFGGQVQSWITAHVQHGNADVVITGNNGADGIVQVLGSGNVHSPTLNATPTLTALAAFAHVNNACMSVINIGFNSNPASVGTDFSLLGTYVRPDGAFGTIAQWKNSNDTVHELTVCTNSADMFSGMAWELNHVTTNAIRGNAQFSLTNPQFLAGIAVTRAELLNPKAWF